MTKILTVIGARPQFIKAATISRLIKVDSALEEVLVHTGQHFDADMSDIFFEQLGIPVPKYSLNINSASHAQMTGRMLEAVEGIMLEEKPDIVVVYGDTNSTIAGALAAAKLHIPVAHIEAGLRSFNRRMPEEVNRVIADHVSEYLFCPTHESVKNLANEGITKNVHHVGDVMYDATMYAMARAVDDKVDKEDGDIALMTVHRASSTDSLESLESIVRYCNEFGASHQLTIIFPVHPRTRKLLEGLPKNACSNIKCIAPIGYFEMQALLAKAKYVLTDSGGLQKEAYFHRVPCVTLRSETEWVETINSGWNRLWTQKEYLPKTDITDYGDGKAAEKIIATLRHS